MELRNYNDVDGNEPFDDWLNALKDSKARAIILCYCVEVIRMIRAALSTKRLRI